MKFYFHILRFYDLLVFWFMINIANELYWSSYYQKIIEISWSLNSLFCDSIVFDSEAVVWRCSVKIVFLKISKIWQENTIDGVSFLIKLPPRDMTSTQLLCRKFCENFKTFPHLLREDRAKLFMIEKISSYQVNVNESKDVYEKSKFTEIAFISWKMLM